MELRRITVRNIRSFEEGRLDLRGGTTLLWGDVGSGKTSLLQAIEMALFGFAEVDATYLIRHRARSAEVALTVDDDGRERTFHRRFLRRTRKGRDSFEPDEKGTGLTTGGSTTRYPPTELRRRAIEILGFPDNPNPRAHSDLWRWAVYVPQERMRQILESGDADARLDTVRKALGLERYRRAADNSDLLARELNASADERGRSVERLAGAVEERQRRREEADRAARASEAAASDSSSARAELSGASEALAAARDRRVQFERDVADLARIEHRIAELVDTIDRRSRRRSDLEALSETLRREIDARRSDHAAVEPPGPPVEELRSRREAARRAADRAEPDLTAVDRANAERRACEERLAQAEAAGARARQELADRERALAEAGGPTPADRPAGGPAEDLPVLEAQLQTASHSADLALQALDRSEHVLGELEELRSGGTCPRCGQSVDPARFASHWTEALSARDAARSRSEAALGEREMWTDRRRARERFERALLAWEAAERHRSAAEEARGRQAAECERLDRDRTRAAELLDASAAALAPAATRTDAARRALEEFRRASEALSEAEVADAERRRQAAELRGATERRAMAEAELAPLRSEIERSALELGAERDRRSEIDRRLHEAGDPADAIALGERKVAELEGRLEEAIGRRHRAEADREAATRAVREAEHRIAEREALRVESEELREMAGFLRGEFREALLLLERRRLAHAKVEFDRSLARFFSALLEDPSVVARSDGRFSPWVEMDGEETPPEALSGGERTALALAYRLALAEVVRKAERLKLSTLILDEPTDGFSPEQVQRMGELIESLEIPQVLLVSHEAALGSIADRVVRLEKIDGASRLVEERVAGSEPPPAAPGEPPREPLPAE